MSRPRREKRITWTDEAGNRYHDRQWIKGHASLGSIAAENRLLDVHDPADHHIASLIPNGAAPPVLYVRGTLGPVPFCALTPDGLMFVVMMKDGGGPATISALGSPRTQVEVDCADCHQGFAITEAAIRAEMPTRPRRRPARLRVLV